MKKVSKSLNEWANALTFLGIVMYVLAVVGFTFTNDSIFPVVLTGFAFTILSPILRGLSVLVQNAEEELDKRWLEFNKNAENEEK